MANENLSKAKEAKNDEFYTQYHDIEKEVSAYLEYNPDVFRGKTVHELYADPYVINHKGVFEYILGGEKDKSLLNIRMFDKATINRVYAKQTEAAKAKGVSNCPDCALKGETRIYKLGEMDADHVTAWSKGSASNEKNCQMLCRYHNRSKGNK